MRLIATLLLGLVLIASASGLGMQESTQPTVSTAKSAALGRYLIDARGYTLYYSTADLPGESVCTGGCEAVWPPYEPAQITVSPSLTQSDFGYLMRGNGRKQLTYKGWPVYRYSRDWAAGDTNGQGLYGRWYVLQPALFGPG